MASRDQIRPDKLYGADLCWVFLIFYSCFTTSPHILQLFGRMLQQGFAVKLQRGFVGEETSHDFPSGWVDNDLIFVFEGTDPLISSEVRKTCMAFVSFDMMGWCLTFSFSDTTSGLKKKVNLSEKETQMMWLLWSAA